MVGWELAVARELALEWKEFDAEMRMERGLAVGRVLLVVEDFIPNRIRSSERAVLGPVRIASALEGMLVRVMFGVGRAVRYQLPSEAKGYGTDDRLRRWGLWTVGREHARDAGRHFALAIAKSCE